RIQDSCQHAKDITRPRMRTVVLPDSKERRPSNRREIFEVGEPERGQPLAQSLRGHVDRSPCPAREGEENVTASRRHPRELVEERDHVEEHYEVELTVHEGK